MEQSLAERLRQRTAEALVEKASREEERRVQAQIAEERKLEARKRAAAEYVAKNLDLEIKRINDQIERSVNNGEENTTRSWTVSHHQTVQDQHRNRIRGDKINAERIADETERAIELRAAVGAYFTSQGVGVVYNDKEDGFEREFPDWGRDFDRTGMKYELEISWADEPPKLDPTQTQIIDSNS